MFSLEYRLPATSQNSNLRNKFLKVYYHIVVLILYVRIISLVSISSSQSNLGQSTVNYRQTIVVNKETFLGSTLTFNECVSQGL